MNGKETTPDFLDAMTQQLAPEEDAPEAEETKGEDVPAEPAKEPEKPAEAPPAAAKPQDTMVPIAALMAERDKRQAFETELEQYRKARQQEEAPKPGTDFYADPVQHIAEVTTQAEQRAAARMYAALEAEARIAFPDYDEVFTEVEAYAKTNPAAAQQVLQAPNPARAAYEMGKKLRELKEMQNPDAYKAKLEAEFRTKWEAEQTAKAQKLDAIPPDLSKTPSASGETRTKHSPVFDQLFKPSS